MFGEKNLIFRAPPRLSGSAYKKQQVKNFNMLRIGRKCVENYAPGQDLILLVSEALLRAKHINGIPDPVLSGACWKNFYRRMRVKYGRQAEYKLTQPDTYDVINSVINVWGGWMEISDYGDGKVPFNFAEEFTQTPGGRQIGSGPKSAQALLQYHLLPLIERLEEGMYLEINLDHCYGFAACFLDEAFTNIPGDVRFEYTEEPENDPIKEIMQYRKEYTEFGK